MSTSIRGAVVASVGALLSVACTGSSPNGPSPGGGGGDGGGEPDLTTGSDASGTGASGPVGSGGKAGGGGTEACLDVTVPCQDTSQCCGDLSCGTTTLGQVCCGEHSAPCATENGEDCCGDLLCVAGTCLASGEMPGFQAPFPCGQSWTYSHHSAEVRRALDFIDEAGNTNGASALAAAAGIATQHYEAGGAGNYIAIEHGGGWRTYYFHLQAFSVNDGAAVTQGQPVGVVGTTGASTGPHLHFEELLWGEGKDIVIDGQPLAPYPGSYGQASIVSANCGY